MADNDKPQSEISMHDIDSASFRMTEVESAHQHKATAKQDISKALSAFDRVIKNTVVNEAAQRGSPMHEAVNTQPAIPTTPTYQGMNGAQIDRFKLFAVPTGNGKSRFDVVDSLNETKIAGDLHIKETAESIIHYMNRGHSFYSPEVYRVLEMENEYQKHYFDAVSFKRKAANGARDMILETRFEDAKDKAVNVRTRIKEFRHTLK